MGLKRLASESHAAEAMLVPHHTLYLGDTASPLPQLDNTLRPGTYRKTPQPTKPSQGL